MDGFWLECRERGIDVSRSFLIDDSCSGLRAAHEAGVYGLFLLTSRGSRELDGLSMQFPVFHGLGDALRWIADFPEPELMLKEAVAAGAQAIGRGELTAFPTETVYGLGADALNPQAVAAIFEAKERPLHDPIIAHIADFAQLADLAEELPEAAEVLARHFWPGPLTLVVKKAASVPDILTAGSPGVAVRMPSHPLALDLIRAAGVPIAAPSANRFGRTSPTTATHVREQLEGRYALLLDGGACRVGVESTVLSLTGDKPVLLRPGGVPREDIEALIGPVQLSGAADEFLAQSIGDDSLVQQALESPGCLSSHYAPLTRLLLVDDPWQFADCADCGFILFGSGGSGNSGGCSDADAEPCYKGPVFNLSADGNLREAAAQLYRAMRELDVLGLRVLYAQRLPFEGLGAALNDRMTRAAYRH